MSVNWEFECEQQGHNLIAKLSLRPLLKRFMSHVSINAIPKLFHLQGALAH